MDETTVLFRTQDQIYADLEAGLLARIPDAFLGIDGVLRIILEVVAAVMESVFLALQILSEDMYVFTANSQALDRHGNDFGVPRALGTVSTGTVLFTGDAGTAIPAGTEVAYDPGNGSDPLYFKTTAGVSIPNPGRPVAPTVAINASAGNLNGTYEYVVTFVTASGETLPGAESAAVSPVNQQVNLSVIPLGGAGTTARKLYRQKNGTGVYNLVHLFSDNTMTTYTDNITDAAVAAGALAPVINSALSISAAASSEASGSDYNVMANAITTLTNAPDGVTDVTNVAPFSGGTDEEATEDYRTRLLAAIRNPQTGSPGDLKTWAEEIAGVDSATVFQDDNLGTPTAGHTTVRISGPGGSVPGSTVQANVLAFLQSKDIANIVLHVGTFTATSTDVAASVTVSAGYVLADVSGAVKTAISNYINNLNVGETVRVAGLTASAFGLPGVTDVTITSPTTNQATGATAKRVPGTITVS